MCSGVRKLFRIQQTYINPPGKLGASISKSQRAFQCAYVPVSDIPSPSLKVALEYFALFRDSTAMYQSVRRPTRDEIGPTALKPPKINFVNACGYGQTGCAVGIPLCAGWLPATQYRPPQLHPYAEGSRASAAALLGAAGTMASALTHC